MNKLAEEILKKHIATIIKTGDKEYDDFYRKSIVLQAMQEYHEAANKGEPCVGKWVAITDYLPNVNEEVLTITADGWYRVMTYGSAPGNRFPSQVTHWIHLPKPPKH